MTKEKKGEMNRESNDARTKARTGSERSHDNGERKFGEGKRSEGNCK
jgi:hypothetical protein